MTGEKRKKIKILFMVFFVAALLLPAGALADEVIRFGILPVVDTLPLLVGVEEGLFVQEGINLEIVSFNSALERDAGLQAGQLDGYFGDILNTVLLIAAGQKIGIVTVAYHTTPQSRMFGLVTSPQAGIEDLSGLKGQAVTISRATIIEYLLDRIMTANDFPIDFVEKKEIKQIPIRLQMLLAGQVPAALLPEPLLTLAEFKGGRVLADDRNLNAALTVLALNRDLLKKDPTLGARFLKAYGQAVKKINAAPESYMELLVTKTRFPEPVKGRYHIPPFPGAGLPAESDVAATQEWMKHNHMIDGPLAYDRIVVPDLY